MLKKALTVFALLFSVTSGAFAWHIEGYVRCLENGAPIDGATVSVTGYTPAIANYTASTTTDADGFYWLALAEEPGGHFEVVLDASVIGQVNSIEPAMPLHIDTTVDNYLFSQDWVVSSPSCGALGCWLTGGGAKFSTLAQMYVAEKGPQVSFGGNVYPGCDPQSGEGGNWNHVDHSAKLHFQGRSIVVDRCGNVDGIPPGSTSPPTPYNFIEYYGTGTLKPIAGGKYAGPTDVCFKARAEDRNEPGSSGVRDGALKDRYFISVFNCDTQEVLLTLGTADAPITITDGNLQIHVSSCP